MRDRDELANLTGSMIDRALGPGPSNEDFDAYKRCLHRAMARRAPRPRGLKLYLGAAAAILTAVGVGFWVLSHTPAQRRFWIGAAEEFAAEGSWARSRDGETVVVSFEGGSQLELVGATAARVVETSEAHVKIDLSSGTLRARIVGDGATAWEVRAGPYVVRVVGTEFCARWIGERSLEVEVSRGEVVVDGVSPGGDSLTVSAGYVLRTDVEGRDVSIQRVPATSSPELPVVPAHDETRASPSEVGAAVVTGGSGEVVDGAMGHGAVSAAASKDTAATTTSIASVEAASGWRARCAAGDYDGVVRGAGEVEVGLISREADLETLWRLANAARYAKRVDVATRLFESIRTRFGGTERASMAAFLLAKIALEFQTEGERARRWFVKYLAEAPEGALREEALAHIMDLCVAQGRAEEARAAAREYLQLFPKGASASRAARIASP
jgi:TolA-binding protein